MSEEKKYLIGIIEDHDGRLVAVSTNEVLFKDKIVDIASYVKPLIDDAKKEADEEWSDVVKGMAKCVRIGKQEAVKEFAEKLKEKANKKGRYLDLWDIDSCLKEYLE